MSIKYNKTLDSNHGRLHDKYWKEMIESDIDSPQSTFDGLRYSMSSSSDFITSSDFGTPMNCNKRMLGEILKSDYLKQLQDESIFREYPNSTSFQPYLDDCRCAKEVFSFEDFESKDEPSKMLNDTEQRNRLTDVLYTTQKLEPEKVVQAIGGIIRQGKYQYNIPRSKTPRNMKVRFADREIMENYSSEIISSDDDGCNFILEYFQCLGPHKY